MTRLTTLLSLLLAANSSLGQDKRHFDQQIAPILARHCISCHSGAEPKGGLDLTDKAKALKGGESGPALVSGSLKKSLAWQRIRAGEMPPKKQLPKKEQETLRKWIAQGAVWGTNPIDVFRYSSNQRAGYNWWSLQPLRRPPIPKVEGATRAIDAFVQQRLAQRKLTPSPIASSREIIRRLSFNLLGLPPTPAEVEQFEQAMAADRDAAVQQLITRLLASKHYGERWARHWLDVARFGESQGFERDKIRDNSWYYRDWVIHSLNNDMPYDEFVRLQIAGDLVRPADPNAVTATGFLVAGAWDEVGQSMRSKAMRAVVRQDEMEDYVGTVGQAFLGLTVNCARCHDHKFDPIRQKEYYRISAALAGVQHGSRQVSSAAHRKKTAELAFRIRQTEDAIAALDAAARKRLIDKAKKATSKLPPRVAPIARWGFQRNKNDSVGKAHANENKASKVANGRLQLDEKAGYAQSKPIPTDLTEKTLEVWVRLSDLQQRAGGAMTIHGTDGVTFDAIVYAESEKKRWMAGSDFYKRTKSFQGTDEGVADKEFVHVAITWGRDGTVTGYRNGRLYGKPYRIEPKHFAAGKWYVLFGLRCGPPDAKRQLRGSLETAQLYNRALTADQIRTSYELEKLAITQEAVLASLKKEEQEQRDTLRKQVTKLQAERKRYRPYSVYAVKPKQPDITHLLARGNPAQKLEPVTPGGIAAVRGLNSEFGIKEDATETERRRLLADWITSKQNPLFARVIVNRLWHYHFGIGLVDTPNDFGFNGGRPSHPALLDYLAAELISSGYRLKHIHRLILSSHTYLQSSRFRADCAAVDADNRLLWRKSLTRLDAETLRDSILAVSGELNRQLGGPPYRDFRTFVSNSQFYVMTDKDSPDVYRRTIYRTWIRSGRNQLLDVFDCPDPSTTAPKRSKTTTPLQALTLMNDSFVMRMADRFASRVTKEAGNSVARQVARAYELAYSRRPDDTERKVGQQFVSKHGLPAYCRVILNTNEFIHVD